MTNDRKRRKRKLKRKQKVILEVLPPGLIDGLPDEDQRAITTMVGKPMVFERYERNGTAKLEFMDKDDAIHLIWVEPKFIKPWLATSVQKHLWEGSGEVSDAKKHSALGDAQKKRQQRKLNRGQRVILKPLPTEVMGNLPRDEQQIITAVVGRPIVFFNEYKRDGRAELEFVGDDNTTHLIYIDPTFVKLW
jgi:hypothetical protein